MAAGQRVWREEVTSGRKDVGLAEDLAHDALLAALEKWPVTDAGQPWCVAHGTAKHQIARARPSRNELSGQCELASFDVGPTR